MGNCLSILCPCFGRSPEYRKIPEQTTISHGNFPVAKFNKVKENEMTAIGGNKFDLELPVFKGDWIDQKFSNKSTYVRKFVWINTETKTLNVSEYARKDRKRQEASLTDFVSVTAGKPDKYKVELSASGEPLEFKDGHLCLSIRFMRGGIDMKFKTEAERDIWLKGILQAWKQ